MSNPFVKAVRTQARLRMGLDGPSGSGKTYTALVAATALANGGKIAVIDTERNSASLYSDKFDFDVVCLDTFHPQKYVDMIHAAEDAGYAVIVLDSLTHAWEGEGGILDQHDDAVKRQKVANSFTAWKDVTPMHRNLVDAILQSKCHVIATMRSKTEYVLEEVESNGRKIQRPRKVGMAPVQRQGMEYEFTIVGDLDVDHNLVISKSRMDAITDAVVTKPDVKWFKKIADWLGSASTLAPAPEPPKPQAVAPVPAPKPPTTSQPTSTPQELNCSPRPYPPDILKARLAERAKTYSGHVVSKAQRNLVAMLLAEIFAGPDSDLQRHALQKYLFDAASLKEVPDPMIMALLEDWLKPLPDEGGAYHPDSTAAKEALAAYNAAILAQGQVPLRI